VSTWLVVWFVIGLVTTVALIAFFIALGRHALVLGRTAGRMRDEVQPIAEDISRMTARQQTRMAELRAKAPSAGRGRGGTGVAG
jgi:hypothetical protein